MAHIHYIIDGSNLLYYSNYVDDCGGDVVLARGELNRALAAVLDEKSETGGVRVTIVYDVRAWAGPASEKENGVEVVYAAGEKSEQPADREILSILAAESASDEELALVTDDASLGREAMYFGCRRVSCADFWKKFGMDYR